jgi:hypothetical protein
MMSEITLVPKDDLIFGAYEKNCGLCVGIGGHDYGIFVSMTTEELRAYATDAMRHCEGYKCEEVESLERNKPSKILKIVSPRNVKFCAKGIMVRYLLNEQVRYVLVLLTTEELKEHAEKAERFYEKVFNYRKKKG